MSKTLNQRTLRSTTHNELTLDNVKNLLENSKKDIVRSLKAELQDLKGIISSLTTRVEKLEEEKKDILNNYQELWQKTKLLEKAGPIGKPPTEVFANEIEQRHARRKNIIVRGLSESDDGSPSERNEKDLHAVKEVLITLSIPDAPIKDVTRLGRIVQGRSRLLRVRFHDLNLRNEILRKSSTLKNSTVYKNVYINRDLTKCEQMQQKELREELTKRRNLGEDVMIRDGKVVKRENQNFRV